MTADELRTHFNRVFGIHPWPKTYEVDAETYAFCCQTVFNHLDKNEEPDIIGPRFHQFKISLGTETNGLMFKNVELILKP